MINIYEDRLEGLWTDNVEFKMAREEIMKEMYGDKAEEKIQRTDYYLSKWISSRAEIQPHKAQWEDIDRLLKGEREENGSGEQSAFVNVMLPNVEGQVASMTNYNVSALVKGRGVGDVKFANTAKTIIDFIVQQNDIRQLVKLTGRKYVRYGNVFSTVGWDAEAFDGMGFPEIRVNGLGEILLDGKVRSPRDLNDMDFYIEEVGQMSVLWAEREYGEDIAKAIQTGNAVADFAEEYSLDDSSSFTLLRVWTKVNPKGNLQMLLMSACGILLEESDPDEPYFSKVFNRYPLFYAGLYPSEGEFWHYGDGKLLKPIQELINKLYDEIILSLKFASQGRTYIDPHAKVDPDEFAECDPSKPIICENPNQNVLNERGTGINDGVYRVLADLFNKVQEVTRFSSIMTGQQGQSKTATEAGILMQQGATGMDDKKGDISKMLSDAVLYAFALCLEHWSAGVALRIADDKDDFEWVDVNQLNNIPKMIPASQKYIQDWKKSMPKKGKADAPKWMNLEVDEEEDDLDNPSIGEDGNVAVNDDGTPVYGKKTTKKSATGQIMIDLHLTIGEGMPNNKITMYNILLSLSQLTLLDEVTMQPTPLLTRKKVVEMLEDILGIVIDEDEEGNLSANGQPLSPPPSGQPPVIPPVNQDANVPNANASGRLAGGV